VRSASSRVEDLRLHQRIQAGDDLVGDRLWCFRTGRGILNPLALTARNLGGKRFPHRRRHAHAAKAHRPLLRSFGDRIWLSSDVSPTLSPGGGIERRARVLEDERNGGDAAQPIGWLSPRTCRQVTVHLSARLQPMIRRPMVDLPLPLSPTDTDKLARDDVKWRGHSIDVRDLPQARRWNRSCTDVLDHKQGDRLSGNGIVPPAGFRHQRGGKEQRIR